MKKWSDYIDYWAVDWDFQNDTFMQGWVAYRTRKKRKIPLVSDMHAYEKPGRYRVLVKVIDVFPDPAPGFVESGYQFMVSGDIFRGRYREDYENPTPIEPDNALEYTIPLPHANHTFQTGHRLMIQIQSSWFPLYDRNPQTYVDSIMFAPADAYKAQRHRIHHDDQNAPYIEFRVDSEQ